MQAAGMCIFTLPLLLVLYAVITSADTNGVTTTTGWE
jgi:hypothetical protein